MQAKHFLSKNSSFMGKRNTRIHLENEGADHVNMYTSKEWKEAESIADLVEAVINMVALEFMIR